MAFSLVAHTQQTGSGTNTPAINTTGSNLIIIGTAYLQAGSATIADSKSNTWTLIDSAVNTSNTTWQFYYSLNPTVGSGHTFNSTASLATIVVAAFSGAAGSAVLDQHNKATNASNVTTQQPGSVTPSLNNELIAVMGGNNAGGGAIVSSVNESFTITDSTAGGPSAIMCGLAYLIQTTASAVNPTLTFSGSGIAGAVIATFKGPQNNWFMSSTFP